MLSPKQHAKVEVLKHVSKMMDTMMSSKMKKKPVAMHMEAEVIPKAPHAEASPLDGETPSEEALETEIPVDGHGLGTPDSHTHDSELSSEDMDRLKHHYSSLK